MKNLSRILTLTVIVALMTMSCKKENVTPDDPDGITTEDLVGNWDFVSLEFNGETYYGCDEDLEINYDLTTLNMRSVTTTHMTLSTNCNNWEFDYDYTLINNEIYVEVKDIKFEIINVDTFNGTVLKLKLINQGTDTTLPLNGIYTLEK